MFYATHRLDDELAVKMPDGTTRNARIVQVGNGHPHRERGVTYRMYTALTDDQRTVYFAAVDGR